MKKQPPNPYLKGQLAASEKYWANLHLILNEAVSYETQNRMDVFEFFECYSAWQPILEARKAESEKLKSKK